MQESNKTIFEDVLCATIEVDQIGNILFRTLSAHVDLAKNHILHEAHLLTQAVAAVAAMFLTQNEDMVFTTDDIIHAAQFQTLSHLAYEPRMPQEIRAKILAYVNHIHLHQKRREAKKLEKLLAASIGTMDTITDWREELAIWAQQRTEEIILQVEVDYHARQNKQRSRKDLEFLEVLEAPYGFRH